MARVRRRSSGSVGREGATLDWVTGDPQRGEIRTFFDPLETWLSSMVKGPGTVPSQIKRVTNCA